MLDSIYHMTLKLFWNHIFGVKNVSILPYVLITLKYFIMLPVNLSTTSGLSILLHGIISLTDATSCDKKT